MLCEGQLSHLQDFKKAEMMLTLALDGCESSLGKHHEDTKMCARNLNILLSRTGRLDEKAAVEKEHPDCRL